MENNLTDQEKKLIAKNQEYWGRRLEKIIYKREKVAVTGLEKELKKLYRQSQNRIKKRIEALYIELIESDSLKLSSLYEKNRLEKLNKQIGKELYKLGKLENKAIEDQLIGSYQLCFKDVAGEIGLEFTKLNKEAVKEIVTSAWSGEDFPNIVWRNKDILIKALDKQIKDVVVLGYSKDKAIKAIEKQFDSGYSNAERLVRTEVMHTLNESMRNVAKKKGFKRIQHLSEIDERTCNICSAINGEIFPIDNYQPLQHPRCRCTGLPVVEDLL